MIIRRLRRHFAARARASVAVELALVSVFFLLPLMAGAVDFVIIMPAKAQLNTALQALYYFALTDSNNATNTSYANKIITKIDAASINQITMPTTMTVNGTNIANGSNTYVCYTTKATDPSFSAPSTNSDACDSHTETTITYINYKVTTTVSLPIPLPGIGRSWTLSASGAVQQQAG